ncbi:tRNA (adenosine(37)-N6)-threonylcarbamoyltransferase complex dimerization subunit type 1 TsaB [Parahaliea maris]|uniref:tRNA threonylcarbamoyladenosine biosynthesis protein TsaB n=1 Tax=Parahaliea maris TaxID=2716870 RepID=A0A5C9A433_9GAMM|nr:tRNA (adenosine(37)-N6)-threonylcarbamoyltransferase complex dimerization subunit type 1 TsaB [Parahaliea maris]TXS95528.1 tRNA (adenosine(37)-N6)-threonylcarbamoyltransferase complex dimerization subunit type 1 TsaB [Parahaliea maris]
MANILAIDTSTDACSVALQREGSISEIHEIIPRQHSQRLFGMLSELLADGKLREQGIEAVSYGAGPGSFTGLRVCASAVQGLCYANSLPAIPVSTLEAQAHAARREGLTRVGEYLLSTLDAHIGELYWNVCHIKEDRIEVVTPPGVCKPADLHVPGDFPLRVVGSGLTHIEQIPAAVRERITATHADLLPRARDQFPAAAAKLSRGDLQQAADVCPVYVRDEISWKKLSEQGKQT